MINKWRDPLFFNKHKKIILLICVAFFAGLAFLIDRKENAHASKSNSITEPDIDTYIPNGFVLVPIEIQNLNSLDSIIGQYGVVDLYTQNATAPIARGLKLIRSPKDPSQFAVLVRDQFSSQIVKLSDRPFRVVVQNPSATVNDVQNKSQKPKIQWED